MMFKKRDRLLVLITAGLLATSFGCDSSKKAPAADGATEQSTEGAQVAGGEEAEAEAEKDVTSLPFYATGPVAVVDGVELEAGRFNVMAERRTARMPGNIPGNLLQMYKKQTLDHVVDEYLIDRRIEAANIVVSDADIEAALTEFKARFPSEEVFAMFIEEQKLDDQTLRENLKKDVALQQVIAKKHNMDVNPEDVVAFYEEHRERFKQSEEVRARHILIKVDEGADEAAVTAARERAEAILQEARASDADFEALARTKSEGPSAPRGGDLGFFARDRMVPEFSEVAFGMSAGQISDLVRTSFGFHIIQVVEKREARDLPFDEVKEHIEMQLKPELQRMAFGKFLAEIKEGVKIELKDENIVVNVKKEQPAAQHGHGHDHDHDHDHAGHAH